MTGTDTAAPVEGSDGAEAAAPARRLGYRPALDGMRAIAITLVVLFHYPWTLKPFQSPPFHGAFLGVDVFFVLSGFLITTLLLEEREATGRVSMRAFYQRRARRLLPAFFVLFVIAIGFHIDGLQPTISGLFGMLFYIANWVQIWQPQSIGGTFGHTWSLAIEEQFYLLFPLLLFLLMRLRLRRWGLALALSGGAVASWAWRISVWSRGAHPKFAFIDWYAAMTGRSVPNTDPLRFRAWTRWYFGTDTRADTLLIGCIAAVVFVQLARRHWSRAFVFGAAVVATLAFVGAGLVIANATIPTSGWVPDWGLFVLELCVALTVLGVVIAPRAPLARLLALPPLVWLGRRSYAIYLFHLVVFQMLRSRHTHLSSVPEFWVTMAGVLLAGELSWRLIETPFMRGRRRFERGPGGSAVEQHAEEQRGDARQSRDRTPHREADA